MDFTKTYIKMSDHPLIQEQWNPKVGDFCLPKKHKHPKVIIKNGTLEGYYLIGKLAVRRSSYDGYWGMSNYKTTLWLPRQDQIQEMFGYYRDSSLLLYSFFKFCFKDSITILMEGGSPLIFQFPISTSREQIWLAFYMHEKHSLTWDGDKWEK